MYFNKGFLFTLLMTFAFLFYAASPLLAFHGGGGGGRFGGGNLGGGGIENRGSFDHGGEFYHQGNFDTFRHGGWWGGNAYYTYPGYNYGVDYYDGDYGVNYNNSGYYYGTPGGNYSPVDNYSVPYGE